MSSDEEDDLPPPFHSVNMENTRNEKIEIILRDTNCWSYKGEFQSPIKEGKFHCHSSSSLRDENVACSKPSSDNNSLCSLESLIVCLSSKALQSPFGFKLYDCLKKEMLSQVYEGTAMKTSCIYWSRNISNPLIEAPVLHLCSAEEFLEHCVSEESLLNFARKLKNLGHGGRNELVLFGHAELKQKCCSIRNSHKDVSQLERIKEFSLLLYVKEFIHCIWMNNVDQVAAYIMHITKAADSLLRKGPRERTKLSEFGNRRRFAEASKASKNSLRDIYKLILERTLGRRSKAVETVIAVYPTLYHLRTAISKHNEQEFVKELTKMSASTAKSGSRTISTKMALQIYHCFLLT
ncbi:hypothetical protein Gasu2_62120 [Galdieria sulphuraria]|nr:hypothetical protein Gasu2_62120 [Galdieria sulphuraria]